MTKGSPMKKPLSRRKFLQASSALVSSMALPSAVATPAARSALSASRGAFRGTLCLFSKPVPQLNWQELAAHAKEAGFGGIDLTVRSAGHVLPERAATDLPQAVAAIRAVGLEVPMITTELLSADSPHANSVLSTVGK